MNIYMVLFFSIDTTGKKEFNTSENFYHSTWI